MATWTFFTNYGHILFMVALNPDISVKEMAISVGITERAILRIISELVKDEFIRIEKLGRRTTYTVNLDKHLRHDVEKNCKIADIIKLIKKTKKEQQD
jgi:DNA-binding IscR family transcriptional regulator